MNKLDKNTFGNSPAAFQLVDALNLRKKPNISKSVSRSISTTAKQVNELIQSYYSGAMSPKTLGNCFRLMRDEVSLSAMFSYGTLLDLKIHQLCRNVQIGHIKRGIRLSTVARKAEHVMQDPSGKRALYYNVDTKYHTETVFTFHDSSTDKVYIAGSTVSYPGDDVSVNYATINAKEVNAGVVERLTENTARRKAKREAAQDWIEP